MYLGGWGAELEDSSSCLLVLKQLRELDSHD